MWRSAKHQDICMSITFPAVNGLPLGVAWDGNLHLVLQMIVISPFAQIIIVNVYLKVLIVYWLLYGTIE